MTTERFTGRIKRYNKSKGYGFIEREREKDAFVHIKNVRGAGSHELFEGDEVSFELGVDAQGRPCAREVIIQLRAAPKP